MTPAANAEPSRSEADHDHDSTPLAVIATRRVRAGHEAAYEAWLAEIHAETRGFPGYLGAQVVRPAKGAPHEYTSILRFASLAALRAWEESASRRAWLSRLPVEAVESEAQLERREGLELWLSPESAAAPVRWKMALVVITVVYSLILILSPIVNFVAGPAPFHLRLLMTVTIEVFLMTYLLMPRITRALDGWLFARSR
jgi:antibiotic biosynthesis monooxygenase (ABM) superfamily enzyme